MGEANVGYAEVWHMIIESLSCLKEVDTSLIGGLVECSNFCSGASNAARERVALKYLENHPIADPSVSIVRPGNSTPNYSSSCEDILTSSLQLKLNRKDAPTVVTDEMELSRDEVLAFIEERKSKLSSPSLDLILSHYKPLMPEPVLEDP